MVAYNGIWILNLCSCIGPICQHQTNMALIIGIGTGTITVLLLNIIAIIAINLSAALNRSSVIQVVQNFDLKTTVKDNIETLISNVSFFIKSLVFRTFFHSKFKWNLFLIDILHQQSLHFHHKFYFFVFGLFFMKWDWLNFLFDFFLQHGLEWMFFLEKKNWYVQFKRENDYFRMVFFV